MIQVPTYVLEIPLLNFISVRNWGTNDRTDLERLREDPEEYEFIEIVEQRRVTHRNRYRLFRSSMPTCPFDYVRRMVVFAGWL